MNKVFTKNKMLGLLLGATMATSLLSGCTLIDSDTKAADVQTENGKVAVVFHQNYSGAEELDPVIVDKDAVVGEDLIPQVSREGYSFAGWYTDKKPKHSDGQYENEWVYGDKYLQYGATPPEDDEPDSMPVTESLDLYARWAKPVEISKASDLDKVREDLSGYYILTDDIDLSEYDNWTPIGNYLPEYEMTNPQWWFEGFRGTFDGNGHKITGLNITNPQNGSALIAAAGNATIKNVTIENYTISGSSKKGVYTCPLLGFGLGNDTLIENCHTSGTIDLKVDNSEDDMVYCGITGLTAGCWGGVIRNCSATGTIKANINVPNGSEINIGGINGEGYTQTYNCETDMNIVVDVNSDAKPVAKTDQHTDVYVGGMQGAATVVKNCTAKGSIDVSISKANGVSSINAGGLVGQARYDSIEDNISQVDISIRDGKTVYVGGVVGSYNTGVYGMIGAMSGIVRNDIKNAIILGSININDTYSRDEIIVGPAVSKSPEGNENPMLKMFLSEDSMPSYNTSGVVYLNSVYHFENVDGTYAYNSKDDLYGTKLKAILGDNWTYEDNKLPTPVVIE